MRYLMLSISFLAALFLSQNALSQCNNWNIVANNINPSYCIANGSFFIQLSGTDVPNLSNIKYSIPLTSLGFSVQPNSSPNFANIPAGTYTVKADANCSSGTISKTTTVVVGGSYTTPSLLVKQLRGSFSCGSYGQVLATVSGSVYPYTIQITASPAAYTGPLSFTTSAASIMIDKLPAGNYTLQMVDNCGNATSNQTVTINSLNAASIPIANGGFSAIANSCNSLRLSKPYIDMSNNSQWQGYYMADSLFKVAYSIDGGATISAFEKMDYVFFAITLPTGKTYKDLYGKNYIFYIQPPCGPVFQLTGYCSPISMQITQNSKCNSGFTTGVNLSGGLICNPVTFNVKEVNTNATYGPYTSSSHSFVTPLLPYGSYNITYTTGDGYTGSGGVYASPPTANPYSVIHDVDKYGLNNYVSRFAFFYSGGIFPTANIQLLSGPPGYAYNANSTSGSTNYFIYSNQAPLTSTNAFFAPGIYTWQIKDDCGTYIIPSNVQQQDVYNYTLDLSNRQQTCQGFKVYPSGTSTYMGSNWPVYFKILSGPPGYSSAIIPAGGAYTLSVRGTYVIGIGSSPDDVFTYGPSPNAYQVTDTIIYDHKPLTVDVNNTQGFLCIGASAGQGQIGIQGMGGIPYKAPTPYYKYYLAAAGNGVSGPYMANNTTGYFSGMGMNANDVFDLKIVDSCGAFVTQQVKILDLSTAQLAVASSPDICEGETLSLYALALPAATYSWTGPNGFTSNLQKPVIANASMAATGQYKVTITTLYCSTPASASVDIVVHPAPGKPVVTVGCTDTSAILTASSVAGAGYQWYKDGNILPGETSTVYTVKNAGVYVVRAIYASTGCNTASDSVYFTAPPGTADTAVVATMQNILCEYDTVTLSAKTIYPSITYQWYRNGIPIVGASGSTLWTGMAGQYTVETSTGPCSKIVSLPIVLEKKVPPAIIRPLGDTVLCEGEKVILLGNSGNGLTYTWKLDGNIIAAATLNLYNAVQTGVYTLDVYNGYCTTTSNSIQILVNERPVASISPADDTYICEGDNLQLVTPPGQEYYYTWLKDGQQINGAMTNTYTTSVAGTYTVIVGNGKCPDDTSVSTVYVVPYPIADLTIEGPVEFCNGGFTILKIPYQPGCTYAWYRNGVPIDNANGYEYRVTVSGDYNATVTSYTCTSESQKQSITVHPLPEPAIKWMEHLLSTGNYVSYQWYRDGEVITGAINATYTITQPGYYTVAVTDTNGCRGISDTVDAVSMDEGCIVRMPSAFTPNNDGKNDIFRLVGFDAYVLYDFRVVNRWGITVFQTTNNMQGWDGKYNGVPQELGSYFYFVKYKCNNEGRIRLQKGDVLLTR
jgi:gliding motility-associated-like protein